MTERSDDDHSGWFSRPPRAGAAADYRRQDYAGHSVAFGDRRPKTLVVEDDGIVASSIERLLRAQALDVTVVRNAEQGLEAFRADPPDLVLIDVLLPGMDGIQFCELLKQDPSGRLTPVVLISGLDTNDCRMRGIDAGADDFLTKPFSTPELIGRVRALLRMKRHVDDLEPAESVLLALARSVEGRDPCTDGHCERLSTNAAELAIRLDLSESEVTALRRAGQLHDIGKIAVPDAILLKDGPLTANEWNVMREHPVTGEHICRPIRAFRTVLPIIRHHHERLDGTGYPDGLGGEEIPLAARVIQVVDIYDALTTIRPYKPALTSRDALDVLAAETDRGWRDPHIVAEFTRMMRGEGVNESSILGTPPDAAQARAR
jgi:putative two-component system response regulator